MHVCGPSDVVASRTSSPLSINNTTSTSHSCLPQSFLSLSYYQSASYRLNLPKSQSAHCRSPPAMAMDMDVDMDLDLGDNNGAFDQGLDTSTPNAMNIVSALLLGD